MAALGWHCPTRVAGQTLIFLFKKNYYYFFLIIIIIIFLTWDGGILGRKKSQNSRIATIWKFGGLSIMF